VAPGDRVVVSMANCPEVGIVYQAVWRAGAVVTPATFLLSALDLRHVISDAEASAVITTPEFVDKVREAASGLDSVRFLASTGDAGDGVLALTSLEQAEPSPVVARKIEDLAALLYTGGHHRPRQGRDAFPRQSPFHRLRRTPADLYRGPEPDAGDTAAVHTHTGSVSRSRGCTPPSRR